MPPMAAALGDKEGVLDVANYVLSLSDSAHDSVRAARGKEKFAACAACHGPEAKGNPALGAPEPHEQDLAVRRHGGDHH